MSVSAVCLLSFASSRPSLPVCPFWSSVVSFCLDASSLPRAPARSLVCLVLDGLHFSAPPTCCSVPTQQPCRACLSSAVDSTPANALRIGVCKVCWLSPFDNVLVSFFHNLLVSLHRGSPLMGMSCCMWHRGADCHVDPRLPANMAQNLSPAGLAVCCPASALSLPCLSPASAAL